MLLHKLRVGIGIEEEQQPDEDLNRMAAGMTPKPLAIPGRPAPMTPALEVQVMDQAESWPKTPVEADDVLDHVLERAQTIEDLESVKEEIEAAGDVSDAAEDVTLFGWQAASQGLVEIDSSSGSDSSSSDTSSSEEEAEQPERKTLQYREEVPESLTYYRHKRSQILHKLSNGNEVFACKVRPNVNFVELDRVIHFKFPKCLRCFPNDSGRIRNIDQLTEALDSAVSKARKTST